MSFFYLHKEFPCLATSSYFLNSNYLHPYSLTHCYLKIVPSFLLQEDFSFANLPNLELLMHLLGHISGYLLQNKLGDLFVGHLPGSHSLLGFKNRQISLVEVFAKDPDSVSGFSYHYCLEHTCAFQLVQHVSAVEIF